MKWHDDEFLEAVSHLSQYILLHASIGDQIVIGTDSNCSSKSTFRRRESWRIFCDTFSLKVHNTENPTFHHNNGTSESTIDFFVTSCSLDTGKLSQYCTLNTPLNLSSHDPITSTIAIKDISEKQNSKFSDTYTEFNREKIIWEESKMAEYHELAGQALSDASKFWDTPETIPLLVSLFSNLLVKCAKMIFPTKSSNASTVLKSSKNIAHAEYMLSKTFNKWKKAGKPSSNSDPSRYAYTAARSNLQRTRRYEDNLQTIRQNNYLMYAERNDRNKVYARKKKKT